MARPSLTPRQVALGLDLFTGAAVLSVAIALAGLTWRLAGHAGTGAITVPDAGRLPPVVAVAGTTTGTTAFQPFGHAAPGDASQPTGLALELKGLIFARPAELASAFVAVNGAEPISVKIGDSVAGATVQEIGRDRIILLNGGRSEYLAMPDPFAAPPQPGVPGAAPAAGGASPPPPPAGASPVAAAPPPSPTALLQRFNATPTAEGLRIGAGAPGGLRQGDVIQSLNGTALSDPAAAQSAFAAAQAAGAARVDIVRNGQRVTLTVPTR